MVQHQSLRRRIFPQEPLELEYSLLVIGLASFDSTFLIDPQSIGTCLNIDFFFRKQYSKCKSIHLYFSSKAPLHMIVMATLKDRTRICPDRWLKCIEIGIYIAMNIKYRWCIGTEYNYQSQTLSNQFSVRSRHKGTLTVVGFAACIENKTIREDGSKNKQSLISTN